jgi:hypothetical protein
MDQRWSRHGGPPTGWSPSSADVSRYDRALLCNSFRSSSSIGMGSGGLPCKAVDNEELSVDVRTRTASGRTIKHLHYLEAGTACERQICPYRTSVVELGSEARQREFEGRIRIQSFSVFDACSNLDLYVKHD